MAVLTYSIHYPKPEKEALLIDAMRQAGKIIKGLPGNLYDNAFQAHCLTKNLTLSHSLNALYVKHFLPVQQGHNVAYLPSPKRQEVDTMRSQRQISREATRGVSVTSAEVSRAGLFQGE